jgi:L-ascorbate metabolism protein UlaG (beta-lactamase superfamily)
MNLTIWRLIKGAFLYLMMIGLFACKGHPLADQIVRDTVHIKKEDATIVINDVAQKSMTIHYLGVGGFAFELDGNRLITAPSYTNPAFCKNIPGIPLNANTDRINQLFPEYLRDENLNKPVQGILVGHSHYDHLLDVPELMTTHLKDATAYGSETMAALLDQFGHDCSGPSPRSKILNGIAGPIKVSDRISIHAFPSHHAPHFLRHTTQKGKYSCGDKNHPLTAWGWKRGMVFSYLIDFMNDSGEIEFRIFYQDSASEPGAGLVPRKILKQKPVDVAILTMAGSSNVANYPASIVENTDARLYVIGHWEDFFGSYNQAPVVARGTDELKFINDLKAVVSGSKWVLTMPTKKLTIEY